ncbi:MAG: hypothetical protein JW829_04705, partial [Pirellulales bacterium]|nr:hypothetical protein [Pirellulales bacterium]
MKRLAFIHCSAVLVAMWTMTATAQENPPGRGPWPNRGPEFRQKMIEKFDADGDGTLDEAERTKAREAVQARMERSGAGARGKQAGTNPMAWQWKGPQSRGPAGAWHGPAFMGPRPNWTPGKWNPPSPQKKHGVMRLVSFIDINHDGTLDQREVRLAHARIDRIANRLSHAPPQHFRAPGAQRGKGPGTGMRIQGAKQGKGPGTMMWGPGAPQGKGPGPGLRAQGAKHAKGPGPGLRAQGAKH